MSSELAIMENGMIVPDFSDIRNYRLRQATQKIFRLTNAAKRNLFEIAVTLLKIQTEELYTEDGYSNIYEYGEKVLGYKKAMTNNLVRIAGQYIEKETMKSILATDSGDYSVSQLQELLVIEPTDAKQLSDSEIITPTMTTKAIREAVKNFREAEKEEPEEPTEDSVSGEGEDGSCESEDEYNTAYEDFHKFYNELKEFLSTVPADTTVAKESLLPSIMSSVMTMHEKR